MTPLASRKCVPCDKGTPALRGSELHSYAQQLSGWDVEGEERLSKQFKFPDFATALLFVNKVGALAEAEGHHPELTLGWGRVGVELWTHAIGGLSEADFILAAKIDQIRQ